MKVLVANRGEIAVRIMRACRELGFTSVAVYSEADQEALHTRYADEAVMIGSASAKDSYLNIEKIIQVAVEKRVDAIHPGYGFLSENETFARKVEEAGIIFVGPQPETISLTGDKLAARRVAREAGLRVLAGPDLPVDQQSIDPEELLAKVEVEFPIMVKAISGGGGRGIRIAHNRDELMGMIRDARREAQASFGDDGVYLEPFVNRARHIEVQIVGDGHGNVIVLGERECSIQRRRQKLIEEAPAPGLTDRQRKQVHEYARQLGEKLNYRSLGTVEFLLDQSGRYYFIEVNPRIQVEHPVTELVIGMDLVRMQLRLADEGHLRITQKDVFARGAAIEARVLAEDAANSFMPATGTITYVKEPDGPGIRVDSALYLGMNVTTHYDSLLAKVIVWGEDREIAVQRLKRALEEFQISGVPTDIEFLSTILTQENFVRGTVDTTFLDDFKPIMGQTSVALEKIVALATALVEHNQKAAQQNPRAAENNWRTTAWKEQMRGAF
ncbi:ATP-grasp domain-containing protein [bacterium]|nr:ATP-grasp domain-containing protein [bacterium]